MIGKRLAHYDIEDKIGSGGMGEVYAARDTRLGREVAIKVLPEELAGDADRLQRFEREAKTVAGLNHPNIVTIHAVEEADGVRFMTMELVRGRTLDEIIPEGGLPLPDFLELAVPLVDAVAAAHARNVQHRDLKPANVMVDESGRVKVLDFGLAKINEDTEGPDGMTQMLTGELTGEGKIMGTIAYMSPEQAEGKALDHRSDIFSLGILLYEMITGRRPFEGDTSLSVLSSILKDEPDSVSDVRDAIPVPIARLVQRALAKRPDQRYQSASDLRQDLQDIKRDVETGEVLASGLYSGAHPKVRSPASIDWRRWAPIGGAALGIVLLLAALLPWLRPDPQRPLPPLPRSAPGAGGVGGGVGGPDGPAAVAVFYFDNISDDDELEWLRTGLAEMLVTDLAQSPGLRVLATDRLYAILAHHDAAEARVTSFDVVRQVAGETGMNRAVVGSFARAGEQVRINARIQDTATAEVLSSGSVSGSIEEIFELVDELSDWVRDALEMGAMPQAMPDEMVAAGMGDRDLQSVTTTNVEAFRLYNEGVKLAQQSRAAAAIPLLERAVELDPDFAMAHAKLSVAHGNVGNTDKEMEHATQAREMAHKLPARERLYIEGRYFSLKLETATESVEAYRKAVDMFPDHEAARHNLAQQLLDLERFDDAIPHLEQLRGQRTRFAPSYSALARAYSVRGRYDDASEVLREFTDVFPDNPQGYFNLATELTRAGRFDEALAALDTSLELDPDPRRQEFRWGVLAIAERWDEAAELAAEFLGNDDRRRLSGHRAAYLGAMYFGRLDEAERHLVEAKSLAGTGSPEWVQVVFMENGHALNLGQPERMLRLAAEIERHAPGPRTAQNVAVNRGVAHALRGDLAAARRAMRGLQEQTARLPLQERSRRRIRAQIDGVLAWASRDAERAVRDLRTTLDLLPERDLNDEGYAMRYFLADALWATGERDAAAEHYRALVDATSTRLYEPVLWLRSMQRLGVYHAEHGEERTAREFLRRYLDYWGEGELDSDRVAEARRHLE